MGKRIKQWIGGAKSYEPQTDASTGVGDVIEMIPAIQSTDEMGASTQFLIEAIYLHFSIKRILITDFDALGFVVWQSPVVEAGNSPVQSLDALSLIARNYSNKRIMMMAPLPYPPFLASSDLASAIVNGEGKTAHHEYQANRKHDRSNTVLALAINSDVSVVTNVFAQWRVLVSYAA